MQSRMYTDVVREVQKHVRRRQTVKIASHFLTYHHGRGKVDGKLPKVDGKLQPDFRLQRRETRVRSARKEEGKSSWTANHRADLSARNLVIRKGLLQPQYPLPACESRAESSASGLDNLAVEGRAFGCREGHLGVGEGKGIWVSMGERAFGCPWEEGRGQKGTGGRSKED
eukprot:451091-Pleurochrysis_carterae.AAC.3